MKFSCEKALLQSAISTAARAVSPKSSIPALEGILLEANEDGLRLTGYNLDTGIRTTVPAEVTQTGTMVLAPRGYHPTVATPGTRNTYLWVLTAFSHNSRRYDLAVTDPEYPV